MVREKVKDLVEPEGDMLENHFYNPAPYPDAVPDPETYMGTGIGFLYGYTGSERFAWEMAGWNITRRGAEVRTRRMGARLSNSEKRRIRTNGGISN